MDPSLEALWEHYRLLLPALLVRVAVAAIILVVLWLIGSGVQRLVQRVFAARAVSPDLIFFVGRSAKIALVTLGGVTALGTLGVDVTALVAGLGLVGFALGFALKDMISNALAGILILLYKPFRRGDHIAVDPNQGVVVEINLRYTVLSAEDMRILIPNATLFTNVVKVSLKGGPLQTPPASPPN